MTFDGKPNAPIIPRYSRSSTTTLTDADKKKVEELKSWAVSVGIVEPNVDVTLAELTDNLYFDFHCQVVHVDSEQKILYVWDGTEPSFKGLVSNNALETFANATKWGSKVVGKCVKVSINGCDLESTCKTGQYILIPSLHSVLEDVSGNERGGDTQIPLLTLHERILSRRRIKILDDANSHVKVLEQRMEVLPTPPIPRDSQEVPMINERPPLDMETDLSKVKITQSPNRRRPREDAAKATEMPVCKATATRPTPAFHTTDNTTTNETRVQPSNQENTITAANVATSSRVLRSNQATKPPADVSCDVHTNPASKPSVSSASNQVTVQPTAGEARVPSSDISRWVHTKQATKPRLDESCETASDQTTVNPTTDPSTSLHTIGDIRNGAVPAKFRCYATVRYVMPNEPERFVKYVCKTCRQRYEPCDIMNISENPDFSAIVKCTKPNCSASLSLAIQFSLILQDDTGLLDVAVSDKVARKFLPHVEPVKLLTDEETQSIVVQFFRTLIFKRHCIESEIKRFICPDGKTVYSLTNSKYGSPEKVLNDNVSQNLPEKQRKLQH